MPLFKRKDGTLLKNLHIFRRLNPYMMRSITEATIFIPLTFIAGLYGINFEYMPELQWKYGYFVALGTMIITGIIILVILKRKKWI